MLLHVYHINYIFQKQDSYNLDIEIWLFSPEGIYIISIVFCTERVDHFEIDIFLIFNTNTDILI